MLKANDFERIEGGALIRVQIWSNVDKVKFTSGIKKGLKKRHAV